MNKLLKSCTLVALFLLTCIGICGSIAGYIRAEDVLSQSQLQVGDLVMSIGLVCLGMILASLSACAAWDVWGAKL